MKQILGCLLIGVLIVGCLDEEDNPISAALGVDRGDLVGTWVADPDDFKKVEDLADLDSMEWTFNDDGTAVNTFGIAGDTAAIPGEWSLKGNTLTLWLDGASQGDYIVVITGSTLTLTDADDVLMRYTKKS